MSSISENVYAVLILNLIVQQSICKRWTQIFQELKDSIGEFAGNDAEPVSGRCQGERGAVQGNTTPGNVSPLHGFAGFGRRSCTNTSLVKDEIHAAKPGFHFQKRVSRSSERSFFRGLFSNVAGVLK